MKTNPEISTKTPVKRTTSSNDKPTKISLSILLLVMLTSLIGIFTNTDLYTLSSTRPTPTPTPIPATIPTQIANLSNEVNYLRTQIDGLNQLISSNPNPDLVILADNLASIDARLLKLENVLLDNPERAMSLVIMKRDIDNIEAKIQENKEVNQNDIDRLYTDNQRNIGLIITTILSFIGLLVTILLRKPEILNRRQDHQENE